MPLSDETTRLSTSAPHPRHRRAEHVLFAAQGEEATLLDPRGGLYYGLNEVGTRVWSLLADAVTLPMIVEVIRREYHVPAGGGRTLVERDVARLLGDLRDAGLVVTEMSSRWVEAPAAEPGPDDGGLDGRSSDGE